MVLKLHGIGLAGQEWRRRWKFATGVEGWREWVGLVEKKELF